MFKKLLTTRSLCLSAIIAALYAALTLLLAVNNKIVQRAQHHEKSRHYYKQDPYDLAGGFFLVFLSFSNTFR